MIGAQPIAGHALALAAALYVPVGLFAPKAEVPLLALAVLVLLLAPDRLRRVGQALRSPLAVLLGLLLGWGALSAAWAIDPAGALALAGRLALLFLGALLLIDAGARLAPEARATVDAGLLIGAALGLGLIAVELLFDMPIRAAYEGIEGDPQPYRSFWMNRGMTALALFAWPAAAALWGSGWRRLAVCLLACALGLVLLGPQRTAQLAILAALMAAALGLLLRGRAALLLAAVAAAGCLAAPLAPKLLPDPARLEAARPDVAFSLIHRLHIWDFATRRIAERPLVGWGLDSSRDMPGGQEPLPGNPRAVRLPLHPHNGALQVWLELGLPGAILLAAIVAYACLAARAVADAGPVPFAAALATITTGLVIGLASYGIWQTQWLATLAMAAAFATAATRQSNGRREDSARW